MKELEAKGHKVRVSFDRATREYTVTPYYWKDRQGWKPYKPGQYFTDSKTDAWTTAHEIYRTFKAPE